MYSEVNKIVLFCCINHHGKYNIINTPNVKYILRII